MKRYDDALASFQIASQYNPQSQEVSRKIKKINQLVKDSKRAQEVENMRSNVDMAKHLDTLKPEMAFETPETHGSCFSFLRQYAEESFSKAACLVAAKKIIAYPQVWKGQGSRKWKHAQSDGFFVQFESPSVRKLWFIPSSNEKGQTLCRDPEVLDIGSHEVVPRLFKEKTSSS
ncbi:tetratricopeptide repeat-containing protein [Trifolium repens]|nr:tetratricopeptide repeat-containing protein [Trifolium repens]